MLRHPLRWSTRLSLPAWIVIAVVSVSPALAQRGQSGLPAGPGNPLAALAGSGAASPAGLAVHDALGTKVGEVVGLLDMSVPVVALPLPDGRYAALRATANHLYGVRVVFEAEDCAGAPLLTAPFFDSPLPISTTVALAGVAPPGHTVYAAALDAVPGNVQVRSRLTVDGTCVSSSFTSWAWVVPAAAVLDLDAAYSAPYAVR
jgi:hypothetical protein